MCDDFAKMRINAVTTLDRELGKTHKRLTSQGKIWRKNDNDDDDDDETAISNIIIFIIIIFFFVLSQHYSAGISIEIREATRLLRILTRTTSLGVHLVSNWLGIKYQHSKGVFYLCFYPPSD